MKDLLIGFALFRTATVGLVYTPVQICYLGWSVESLVLSKTSSGPDGNQLNPIAETK